MATIFLSYRRTDSPQACRVYDWLKRRFGEDAVFMDVAAIPAAVDFSEFIRQAIANSKILIALIGADWLAKTHQADDPVRMEIEVAIASHIPILPVLIGNTPMPDAEDLPASISTMASQNAVTVGVLHDFHTHMQLLLPRIESILGALSGQRAVNLDPFVIQRSCHGIMRYLSEEFPRSEVGANYYSNWEVINTATFLRQISSPMAVTLFLHRVGRLAELIELHFMLSFWSADPSTDLILAGWVRSQLEQTPIIPDKFFLADQRTSEYDVKIRLSDEDARQVWKMVTNEPLRLSLAYVATLSPKRRGGELRR